MIDNLRVVGVMQKQDSPGLVGFSCLNLSL